MMALIWSLLESMWNEDLDRFHPSLLNKKITDVTSFRNKNQSVTK